MWSVSVDGRHPSVEVLAQRATVNYGHFTSMQVRNRAVKGLDLHLARLRAASAELHNAQLDTQKVRSYLQAALTGTEHASVRVDVFPAAAGSGEHIMVTVSEPVSPPERPLTLKSVAYQRPVPHIKHAGGFGQLFHQKQVQRAGFDDALLTAGRGEVLETATANIGFIRGGEVIWPAADALHGITWQLLTPLLTAGSISGSRRPVHLHQLHTFDAAFTANSYGLAPVRRIDEVDFPTENETVKKLAALYGDVSFQQI